MNLKESAEQYERKTTKNIAELGEVSVRIDIQTREYKVGTPEEYKINVVVVHGLDYRVPDSVLIQLQELLKKYPTLEFFNVMKTGSGVNDTRYNVIPLGIGVKAQK